MIRKYFEERIKIVNEAISLNEIKLEHNLISANKIKCQIEKITNQVDEATNIFSVVAREDNRYKNKEIQELEQELVIYNEERKELESVLECKRKELDNIKVCLEQLKDKECQQSETVVYKVTEDKVDAFGDDLEEKNENTESKIDNYQIIKKLTFCKNLVNLDPIRTQIEIENIIESLENR